MISMMTIFIICGVMMALWAFVACIIYPEDSYYSIPLTVSDQTGGISERFRKRTFICGKYNLNSSQTPQQSTLSYISMLIAITMRSMTKSWTRIGDYLPYSQNNLPLYSKMENGNNRNRRINIIFSVLASLVLYPFNCLYILGLSIGKLLLPIVSIFESSKPVIPIYINENNKGMYYDYDWACILGKLVKLKEG
ncbi:hypothetical protein V1511DRAFT_505881 [Dipodascopsis uninucleata]